MLKIIFVAIIGVAFFSVRSFGYTHFLFSERKKNEISFTKIVAVDNDECTIKSTDIDPDNLWGYTLKVQLENNTTEKTYMYSVENTSMF